MLLPGTRIDRYELVAPIGQGGMAEVWLARQKGRHGFEKLFAMKCIHSRLADEPEFRAMFLDEARIVASIEHPNVAQVFDLGEASSMLYLVMELVDGESLGALMTANARRANAAVPAPLGVALRIVAATCAGLQAAHELRDPAGRLRGVVHRDVSPQNVLVSVRGDVKLIDFGIALARDRIGRDTEAGSLKGKLNYMAPEQALREPVGPYSDVFATGALLYRLLAGRPPYEAGHDAATLQQLISGARPAPLPSTVPAGVMAIIERALARQPGDRFATAGEMGAAIEAAISEMQCTADVAAWVNASLSDAARRRRSELAASVPNIAPEEPQPPTDPEFVAELGPSPRNKSVAPHDAALPADAAQQARAATPPAPPEALPLPPVAPQRAAVIAPVGIPPVEEEEPSHPGMLDVRALVARASEPRMEAARDARNGKAAARPGSLPPARSESTEGGPDPAPARDVEHGVDKVRPAREAAASAGTRSGAFTNLAVIATLVVVLLVGALLVLPRIVHDRIVASAREAGIELVVDRVGLGFGGVALRGVTARVDRLPGAELRADEIFATGFSARHVRVRGLDVKIDGRVGDVVPVALRLYEENRERLAGTAGESRRVSVLAAHLTWTGLLGEGTRLSAGELAMELESRAPGAEDVRTTIGRFELETKRRVVGPWSASFERNITTSRVRLLFDPPVPDGPSALYVWGKASSPHLTVKIPRSPIARLGLRPEDLGLVADPATEVEVKLEGDQRPTTRLEGAGRVDIFGLRLRGLKSPVDVRIEGTASGSPGKPLALEKTTVTLGPFLANVTGAIAPNELGFRLDAAWRMLPIPCEKLARAEAKSMGSLAAAIQDIAHATGAVRVTGTANASGIVKFDTQALDDASMTVLTNETCGVSIFGM